MSKNTDIPEFAKCKCGCGEHVSSSRANYRPGHDARHKGQIARQVLATGETEWYKNLPSPELRQQAMDLVEKWSTDGKAPKGKSATEQVEYRLKIGRWDYPVKHEDGNWFVNKKRDGSGDWTSIGSTSRVYTVQNGEKK